MLALCLVTDNYSAASAGKTARLVAKQPKVIFDVGVFDATSIVSVLLVLQLAFALDELSGVWAQNCGVK